MCVCACGLAGDATQTACLPGCCPLREMVRLSNEEFLTQLVALFSSSSETGSVFVTFKHHAEGETPCCLVRAVAGKTKTSTFVRSRRGGTGVGMGVPRVVGVGAPSGVHE